VTGALGMTRRLFNVVTVRSLLLRMAVVVLWVRSYEMTDVVRVVTSRRSIAAVTTLNGVPTPGRGDQRRPGHLSEISNLCAWRLFG
jgi:hypothetical protein